MRIYWCEYSIPELAALPRQEARKVWLRCYRKLYRTWQFWLGVVLGMALGISGAYFGSQTGFSWGRLAGAIVGISCGLFIAAQLSFRAVQPFVAQELRRRRIRPRGDG